MRGRCVCDYVGSMTQRNTALSAIVGIVVCGLVGCAAEGAPAQPSTQVTESVAAEPSSTYTIPPRPAMEPPAEPELTGVDIDNAYVLAKYYFDLYQYVVTTGETASWEKYAHPECEYCAKVQANAEKDRETGSWSDVKFGILNSERFYSTGDIDFRIDFLIERGEITYYTPDEAHKVDPGQNTLVIGLKAEGDELLVRSFDIIGSSFFGQEQLP